MMTAAISSTNVRQIPVLESEPVRDISGVPVSDLPCHAGVRLSAITEPRGVEGSRHARLDQSHS